MNEVGGAARAENARGAGWARSVQPNGGDIVHAHAGLPCSRLEALANLPQADRRPLGGERRVLAQACDEKSLVRADDGVVNGGAAKVDSAATLLLSAAGLQHGAEIIRIARQLNPRIRVLARTAYIAERPALKGAGADQVFSGEEKVAVAMMESMLRALGATPEQIDQERERIDRELSALDEDV